MLLFRRCACSVLEDQLHSKPREQALKTFEPSANRSVAEKQTVAAYFMAPGNCKLKDQARLLLPKD